MSQHNAALTSQGPRSVEPPGIAAEPVDSHQHQCLLFVRSPMEHATVTQLLWLNFHSASGEYAYVCFAPYSVEILATGAECWAVHNTGERPCIPDQAGAGLGIGIILAILRRFWAAAARWNSSFAPL